MIWSYLRTILNSCASFLINIIEKGMSQSLFIFVFSIGNNEIINCVICYFGYLSSILNDDSFKEYINPVVFINLKFTL